MIDWRFTRGVLPQTEKAVNNKKIKLKKNLDSCSHEISPAKSV